jgi:WD40 repeat protein
VVAEAQALCAAHPLHEQFWVHLVTGLYRCGRQADALAALRRVRALLAEEIGADPGAELVALERRVLRQDPALAAPTRPYPTEPLPPELDPAGRPLFGRDAELAWLEQAWADVARGGLSRLLVIAGPAGSGRSRLAAEFAARLHARGVRVHYARMGPGLTVLDDLDDQSVGQIAAGLPDEATLCVTAYDPATASAGLRRALQAAAAEERVLVPLGRADIARIVARLAGSVDAEVEEEIVSAAGGWPGEAERLAARLVEQRSARRVVAGVEQAGPASRALAAAREEVASGVQDLARVRALRPGAAAGADRIACPYKGLAAYQPNDSPMFYGREELVARLCARLVDTAFVAVVGPSGAGKSSLVQAGLLPALAAGVLPGLAEAQQHLLAPGTPPPTLTGPAVLVVDQFEEVFAMITDDLARERYLDNLTALAARPGTRVVVVLRGDFVGACAAHARLAQVLGDGTVLVGPMRPEEIRRAVEQPARGVGLRTEAALADAVVSDMQDAPGALPLMSTALVEVWQGRSGDTLTAAAYHRAGGVPGALTRLGEAALASLDEPARAAARIILLRLAETGEGGQLVRRRVPRRELGDDPATDRALTELVSRRLLTAGDTGLEVTHETVLTHWPRLAGWLAEDAQGRALRRHLAPAAAEWDATGRPDTELYRGARLASALDWAGDRLPELTDVERAFLTASRDYADRELAEESARADRQARARRRLLAALAAAVSLLLVAAGATRAAVNRQHAADASALRADADRLAAAAATVAAPDLSLLLAAQAYKTERTPQTEAALLGAAVEHRKIVGVYRAAGIARQLAVSPDGRILYAHTDTQVVAWDVTTHRPRVLTDYRSAAADPKDVAASPARTGDTAGLVAVVTPQVSGSAGSALTLFGPDGRERWIRRVSDLGGWPLTARFTADGRRLGVVVVAGYGGAAPVRSALYVDTRTGRAEAPVFRERLAAGVDTSGWRHGFSADALAVEAVATGPPEILTIDDLPRGKAMTLALPAGSDSVEVFPAGRGWLVAMPDGTTYWYPPGTTRAPQRIADHTSWVSAAATDATGSVLVTAAPDQRLVVSDLVGGRWVRREVLPAKGGTVLALAVNRAGTRAYSAGDDGIVTMWDLTDREGFGAQIRTPQVRGVDPTALIVIGDPVLAGRTGNWVVPVQQWERVERQGPIFAVFVNPHTREAVGSVRASVRPPVGYPRETVSLSPDGRRVAITTMFSTAVIDVDHRRVVHQITLPSVPAAIASDGETVHNVPEPVVASAWSSDGRRLFLATLGARGVGPRGAVVVVDTATWKQTDRVLPAGDTEAVAVSPDGRIIALSMQSGDVVLADAGTYQLTHRLHVDDRYSKVSFSDDGTRLAAVGDSRRLNVWDPRTGEPVLATVPSFVGGGTSLRWLPNSHTVVYGGEDGQATLFDTDASVQRGVSLPVFADAGVGDVHIATVADGRLALFGGYRSIGQTRQGVAYPLAPSDWLAHACSIVRRDLTPTEWAVYLPGRSYRPTCNG